MEINIQRRSKIALRSLPQNEQQQILKALDQLRSFQFQDIDKIERLKELPNDSNENLYTYPGNYELRLILSIKNNVCVVEDILAYDKLDRFVANLNKS